MTSEIEQYVKSVRPEFEARLREWVEIPLSPERPGLVRRLPNGKLEIIVDADQPFEDWLGSLPKHIQLVQGA